MSGTPSDRRAIDGVLLLDKPAGITSQTAVTRAKSLLSAVKAGHTGTLDPMATGLLPLAFGEATKFSHALLDADKGYCAVVRLGITTTTGDLEGEVLTRAVADVPRDRVEAALAQFRGDIAQTPPMYSAIKHAGKALYTYARAGVTVARAPRRVTIRTLELRSCEGPDLRLQIVCSKGTYIRVLAEDLGRALGCGATLTALRRTQVGHLRVDDALGLHDLEALTARERADRLLRVDALVADLPSLELDSAESDRLSHGQTLARTPTTASGLVRVYGPRLRFLGVAVATTEGQLVPRRLISRGPLEA